MIIKYIQLQEKYQNIWFKHMKNLLYIALVCFTLGFIYGCNPLDILCMDDPDCPRVYFHDPYSNKKEHVNRVNIITTCDDPYKCHELIEPTMCQMCVTEYKDDENRIWSGKPFKEYVKMNRIKEKK